MKISEENRGFFFHISVFFRERFPDAGLCDLVAQLETHESGLRRCISIYYLDAFVANDGFRGLFFNRFGCLASSAIEGYLRIGAPARARIIRTAVHLCLTEEPSLASVNRLELSSVAATAEPFFMKFNFDNLNSRFHELDLLYYAEQELLPGAGRFKSLTPLGTIDWYADKYPEDFPPDLIGKRKVH